MEYLSNCCGAPIEMADREGTGICSECYEGCAPYIEETEETEETE